MYCPISNQNFVAFFGDSLNNNTVCRESCYHCLVYLRVQTEIDFNECDDSCENDI